MVDRDLRAKLSAPIQDFKWRLQQTAPKDARKPYPPGTRGMFMAYIDARDLYDRLDDVFGIGGWQRTVVAVHADGSVTGRISVRIGDEWIHHDDIGYSNDPGAAHEKEPLKAAASDAYKRAGVGLGVGRFLYELGSKWTEINANGQPLSKADLGTGEITDAPEPNLPPRARTTTQNPIPRDYAPEPETEGAASWTAFWAEARRAGLNDKTALTDAGIPMDDFKHAGEALTALRAKLNGVAA